MQGKYDILIVGAGPAGSCAAIKAAEKNSNILLIDKKKEIGKPVQCAEYIPKLLLNKIDIDDSCISQKINSMKTFDMNGFCYQTKSPGYILNREIFDKKLADLSVKKGVDLYVNTSFIKKEKDNFLIKQNKSLKKIKAKIVIGADGPKSTVGDIISEKNSEFLISAQYKVKLKKSLNHTQVYFRNDIFGGYGWVFPKHDYANIGVGIKQKKDFINLNKILENFISFLEEKGTIENEIISKTGGLIPVGGPLQTVKDNIILVGDAAGHTHSITGGGITQAVICGSLAGKYASDSVENNNKLILKKYEKSWKNIFQEELNRAKNKRILLEKNWSDFEKVFKKCWTVFRDYYE